MRKFKNISFVLLLMVLLGTGTFYYHKKNQSKIEVSRKEVTTEKKPCEKGGDCTCKHDVIQKVYGTVETIQASLSSGILTIQGVPEQLKAVVKLTYEASAGTQENIFYSEELYGKNGTITYEIPVTTPNGSTILMSGDLMVVYFYPIHAYKDDTNRILCLQENPVYYIVPKESTSSNYSLYDNDICVNYRKQYENNQDMIDAVPICFQPTTDIDYDEETVQKMIQTAESTYQYKNALLSKNKVFSWNDENTVSNPSNLQSFMCDAYQKDVLNKDGTIQAYANVKTLNHTKIMYEGTYCKTACKETVTVKYQAPIATQAGLCISYQVEINSKVECATESTGVKPKMKSLCLPSTNCSGSYDWDHDKGGPTEEFDDCINSCDGGKYSQSCINACYSKVYTEEDKTSIQSMKTSLHYEEKPKVLQVASDQKVTCPPNSEGSAYQAPTYTGWNTAQVYAFRQKYPGGKYVKLSNGTWKWESGGICPSYIGYYYFSTPVLTRATLIGLRTSYSTWDNGFLIPSDSRFQCNSSCTWQNSCASSTLQTSYQIIEDYQKQQEAEQKDWEKCNEVLQNSEKTTEYTITVDKDDIDSPNHHVYKSSQTVGKTSKTLIEDGKTIQNNSIVQDTGEFYYESEDGWGYKSVLTFPMEWLDLKGNNTSLRPNSQEKYQKLGNTFCTSFETSDVNVDWYDWKVYQNGNLELLTEEMKAAIEKSRVNNIHVKIGTDNDHLWGLMDWNIELNCFYAVANPNTCKEECCGSRCTDYEEEASKQKDTKKGSSVSPLQSYTFRTVSLEDLFPSSSLDVNGREPRYNWSCAATNTSNKDYYVQPNAVVTSIENKGNTIFQNENDLDYEIHLTKEKIKQVKNYTKKHPNYLESDFDQQTKINGVRVYKSSFLTNVLGDSILKRGLIGCNNQANESTCNNLLVQDDCYFSLMNEE